VPDPIVVTGCASGIGRALAETLRDRGEDVIGLDVRAEGPDGVDARACDLADPAAIDAFVDGLPPALGGLANVAGLPGTHPPERIVAVNLLAPRQLAQVLVDRLPSGAVVVNVASVAAQRSPRSDEDVDAILGCADREAAFDWVRDAGLDGTQTYDFCKKALVALTHRLARAWLARGVRCVSVSPGTVETPILGDFAATMGQDRMDAAAAAVGRHGRPQDVAPVIAFLLSSDAAWINAVDIRADGGLLGTRSAAPA
jgi:NAD(P)-dependent dehydrogenase (short-subunit alcohol dehydrogenase family)